MEKRSGDKYASHDPFGTWRKLSAEIKGKQRGTSLLVQYLHTVLDPDWGGYFKEREHRVFHNTS